ncbi:hypothetical protein F5Y15DRAFT_239244 [Xylariaceae sp. FL0016]|nr:hypothetical protein F5Y15DRAFT_239244 [Xylariaceae sp. FL0016]
MKGSRSVCLLCRHRLAAGGIARSAQRQTQISSLSTTTTNHSDAPSVPEPPEQRSPDSSAPNIRRIFAPDRSRSDTNFRLPRNGSGKPSNKSSARVEALFQDIVQRHVGSDDAPASNAIQNGNDTNLQLVEAIAKLQDMVISDVPITDAYNYLKSDVLPIIRVPGVHITKALRKVVIGLMNKVVAAKKADILSDDLPRVADISRVYADMGALNTQEWIALVGQLAQSILSISNTLSAQGPPNADLEKCHSARELMLGDIVESWKVLSMPGLAVGPNEESDFNDGFWFPSLDKFSLVKYSRKGDFPAAVSAMFPQYRPNQLGPQVAVLAIATYAFLLDGQKSSMIARRSATRFISKIAYLIGFVRFQENSLRGSMKGTFPEVEEFVLSQWPKITAQLKERVESADTPDSQVGSTRSTAGREGSPRKVTAHSLYHRLTQAYSHRNVREIDKLWKEFVPSENELSGRTSELKECPEVFDFFIEARMALNEPKKALAVWNVLGQVGLKPTLRTWNAMLNGCKKAGNAHGIKSVWAKLAASGMELDVPIWTTRVSGLIKAGDFGAGILALEEMSNLWQVPEGSRSRAAIRPSIGPVNAALAGLIRQKQLPMAERLLAWAGRQGIEPDIMTFNTLLRPLIRDGNRDADVRKLFKMMQASGVQVDAATFTLLLDGAFSKTNSGDPVEQAAVVDAVLQEMAAAGLQTNMQTYGKMLYLLLQSNAKEAVNAVLARIWANGEELSPHIYTMLVEYFFGRQPPDLEAVNSLLSHKTFDYNMDRIFYDRVIKGYAIVGHVEEALRLSYKVSDTGAVVTLGTQYELLRKLVEQNMVHEARVLVNTTKTRFEEQHPDPRSWPRFWEHRFWHLARHYKLVDDTPRQSYGAANDTGDTGVEGTVEGQAGESTTSAS